MDKTIPKVIHYCWFGGKPLPKMAKKCIKSWKKYLPDYEIKQWDESNFDINAIPYTSEAYKAGKYAFVSDYARYWILYNYGGLYFDTDVEVIKPLEDILEKGPFMACQNKYNEDKGPEALRVAPGLGLGTYPKHSLYKEMIDVYEKLNFINKDGSLNLTTIVDYNTHILIEHGLQNTPNIQKVGDTYIYPWDYFCPMRPTLEMELTPNSRTIHLFSASWETPSVRFRKALKRLLGYRIINTIQPIIAKIRK